MEVAIHGTKLDLKLLTSSKLNRNGIYLELQDIRSK